MDLGIGSVGGNSTRCRLMESCTGWRPDRDGPFPSRGSYRPRVRSGSYVGADPTVRRRPSRSRKSVIREMTRIAMEHDAIIACGPKRTLPRASRQKRHIHPHLFGLVGMGVCASADPDEVGSISAPSGLRRQVGFQSRSVSVAIEGVCDDVITTQRTVGSLAVR